MNSPIQPSVAAAAITGLAVGYDVGLRVGKRLGRKPRKLLGRGAVLMGLASPFVGGVAMELIMVLPRSWVYLGMGVYGTPGGHFVPRPVLIRETLDWLDRYLGPAN